MIRTQIQLPEDEYEALRTFATRGRRSIADCVREAVRLFLRSKSEAPSRVEEIAGRFRPSLPVELKDHDRWFAEAALSSRRPEGSESPRPAE